VAGVDGVVGGAIWLELLFRRNFCDFRSWYLGYGVYS